MNSAPIAYVLVYVKNDKQNGITTDSNGYFEINCDIGKQTLTFSHASYQYYEKEIRCLGKYSTGKQLYNIYLEEKKHPSKGDCNFWFYSHGYTICI